MGKNMATWQYNLTLSALSSLDQETITHSLDSVLPRGKSWSESILMWGAYDGDRIDLVLEENLLELLVRFDLRTPSKQFMRDVVALVLTHDLRIENEAGASLSPDTTVIGADMTQSEAFRFVTDPGSFLREISTELR